MRRLAPDRTSIQELQDEWKEWFFDGMKKGCRVVCCCAIGIPLGLGLGMYVGENYLKKPETNQQIPMENFRNEQSKAYEE